MKGRSHRLPVASAPPDDWVEESWTVDCVCGVNFDDGEEMVNCDECGVWVHTRCSRYVKGETSFHCDKCKSKRSRNDKEETEVAELLAELPTKPMRVESSCHLSNPPRRPFKLWAERPIEEKVHIHGIPGGDPALFGGLKSVFSKELWNCTGYVPKKFNFQYREFPCWDKREADGDESPDSRGAGVLFSLSKENMLATPLDTGIDSRHVAGDGGSYRKRSLKEMKKSKHDDLDSSRPVKSSGTKEPRLFQPIATHLSKRKKEDQGASKDRSGKKKARTLERESEVKKRMPQPTKPAVTSSYDEKQMEFHKVRGPKFLKSDTQNTKSGKVKDTMSRDSVSDCMLAAEKNTEKRKNTSVATAFSSQAFSDDKLRHNLPSNVGVTPYYPISRITDPVSKTDGGSTPPLPEKIVGKPLESEENQGVSKIINKLESDEGIVSRNVTSDVKPSDSYFKESVIAVPERTDNQPLQSSASDTSLCAAQPYVKVKKEDNFDHPGGVSNARTSHDDVKLEKTSQMTQHPGASGLHSNDCKVKDAGESSVFSTNCHIDKPIDHGSCQFKSELESPNSYLSVQKDSSVAKHNLDHTREPSKVGVTISSPSALPTQYNVASNTDTCSPPSTAAAASKPPVHDNSKSSYCLKPSSVAKQRISTGCNVSMRKDHAENYASRDEERHDMPRKTVTESPKPTISSASKASHLRRSSNHSVSQKTSPDSKDPASDTSSRAYLALNVAVAVGISESAGSVQAQNSVPSENKIPTPCLPHRGEKFSQSSCLPSTKMNHTSPMHPPTLSKAQTALSDEELALLLHQELNSSPRVPRVPRVRQAGNLPQLTSAAATSMLVKRSCSSGGKDNSLVSRRRSRDLSKDGSRSVRDVGDDARKMERLPPSPDQQKPDDICTTDTDVNKNTCDNSSKSVHPTSKSIPHGSIRAGSCGLSSSPEANGHNLTSIRASPSNISDDDTGTSGLAHQTLPGLLSEIMREGKRMTYEELCRAVLPHWQSLRKHNGERYAYSTHSHAVLDCLRNRSEWAQLVDRGPKSTGQTNGNRKRHKVEAESLKVESEHDCGGNSRSAEAVGRNLDPHRDDFPKGKRKARKRRRLALQGKGMKDVRRIRKSDMLTDDDVGPFSESSEESMFSEDETVEYGVHRVGSDAAVSSDDAGVML